MTRHGELRLCGKLIPDEHSVASRYCCHGWNYCWLGSSYCCHANAWCNGILCGSIHCLVTILIYICVCWRSRAAVLPASSKTFFSMTSLLYVCLVIGCVPKRCTLLLYQVGYCPAPASCPPWVHVHPSQYRLAQLSVPE